MAISRAFQEQSGLPGVIGAIDGCHLEIVAPLGMVEKKVSPGYLQLFVLTVTDVARDRFYNRKGFFSLNALAVCDNKRKIRYFTNRWDSIFTVSTFYCICDLLLNVIVLSLYYSKFYRISKQKKYFQKFLQTCKTLDFFSFKPRK